MTAAAQAIPKQPPEPRLLTVLMVMTVVTGFVDAVSYVALGHVFTANMTGNVVLLGFAVAGAPRLSMARSFTSLAAFLLGALLGGAVGRLMDARPRRWLLAIGVSEAALLFAAALAGRGYDLASQTPAGKLYAVIVLTALPMGLRTATVRRLAIPDITTTVLTTTLAGLAADSSLIGGDNPRIGRRLGSVLAMFGGASIGTLLLRFGVSLALLIGGTCVLITTVTYFSSVAEAARTAKE
jgi:uncharacterized membrane protein YoaK (UPF0700 family)